MVTKLVSGKPVFLIRLLVSWCWYHTVSCVQGKWNGEKQALESLLGIFMLCWVQEYLLNSNKFRQEIFNNTGSRKLVGNIKITYNECFWKDLTLSWVSSLILFQSWFDFSVLLSYAAGFYFTCSKFFIFLEKENSGKPLVLSCCKMFPWYLYLSNCSLVVNQG